jgi:DNA polymerase-3 subunit epsilon
MLDRLLTETSFVFLDTETTGLSPRFGDRVVEIALARFHGEVMEDYFVTLVNPQRGISPGAARIHGITDAEVRTAPCFDAIVPQLREHLDGGVIVAHNAPFDLNFVANEFRLARAKVPTNLVLDTLTLLRRHFRFPSNSLPKVAGYLGIDTQRSHRALTDVLTTRAVFGFIASELGAAEGCTLGEFLALQGGTIEWPPHTEAEAPLPPTLEEALRHHRKLFVRYVDESGAVTERWVSPVRVQSKQDYMYLRAYCHLRNAERYFRLDRVLEMRVGE